MSDNYILVDEHGKPVPLPYETTYKGQPVRVIDWFSPGFDSGWEGWCQLNSKSIPRLFPSSLGMRLITEAEFMQRQS